MRKENFQKLSQRLVDDYEGFGDVRLVGQLTPCLLPAPMLTVVMNVAYTQLNQLYFVVTGISDGDRRILQHRTDYWRYVRSRTAEDG